LDAETLLARAGGTSKYRENVEDRVRQGVEETTWEQVKLGIALAELGRKAGGMDYAAVTMAVRRFPEACQRDKSLA